MPRRRRDAAHGPYFIPGGRSGVAVATITTTTALPPGIRVGSVAFEF